MKRKILILIFSVLLTFTFCITSFASAGSNDFGYNLLSDNNKTNLNVDYNDETFYINSFNLTSLEPNTDYTFFSSVPLSGLFISPVNDGILFSKNSENLIFQLPTVIDRNGVNFSRREDGSILVNGTASSQAYNTFKLTRELTNGIYTLSAFKNSEMGSFIYIYFSDGTGATIRNQSYSFEVTDTKKVSYIILNLNGGVSAYNEIWYVNLNEGYNSEYSLSYSEVYSVEGNLSYYTFTTPSSFSDNYYLYFLNNEGEPTGVSEGYQFLIKGNYTEQDIFDIYIDNYNSSSYNTGYNTGYNEGYSTGQSDGLKASNSFSSMVYSILSAPFVIVSNTLNFEILGINILNLVKVILTILLIAFVITRLKGRE